MASPTRCAVTSFSLLLFVGAGVALSLSRSTSARGRPPGEFEDPALVVVYSVSDEDAQIFVRGGAEDPIKRLKIKQAVGDEVMIKSRFNDGGALGQADFQFETPEPALEDLMVAYPAGEYVFSGVTVDGDTLAGVVDLSYDLPPPPVILFPAEGDTGIPVNDLVVRWDPAADAEAIRLEIEDEEEEVALKVDLAGDATTFFVPDNWLQPGTEYTLDIKVHGENGNQTVRDLRFVTAE